jgi:hypothetical protein
MGRKERQKENHLRKVGVGETTEKEQKRVRQRAETGREDSTRLNSFIRRIKLFDSRLQSL